MTTMQTEANIPAWMTVKISLLDTADWDTAQRYIFDRLQGLTVRLTQARTPEMLSNPLPLVGKITDTQAILDDDTAGIRFVPHDDDDEPLPAQEFFVRYEDIVEIGVY